MATESPATATQERREGRRGAFGWFGCLTRRASSAGLKSGGVEQPRELALVVVADFLDRERVFALAQQQELVGPHPHDFVWRGKPAGGDVRAGAFRVGGVTTRK